MNPWNAEQLVSPDLAKRLIEDQFPDLAPVDLKLFGEGWDNVAYLANQHLVFRFPRRQIAVDLIEIESKILPVIGSRLPVAIPNPIYAGGPTEGYPWPFSGYEILTGQTACCANLSPQERFNLAGPLAKFLRALHSIQVPAAAPPDRIQRLDVEMRWPKTYANLCKIDELGLFSNTKALFELLDDLKEVRDQGQHKVLCHGDLYARHLLISRERELCGVIDWGDLHVGNPAVDLAILFAFLPIEARPVFLETYGALDKNTEQLALFRALFSSSLLVVFSHDVGDHDLLREAQTSLDFILEGTLQKKPLVVQTYDPQWPQQFEEEAKKLKSIFAEHLIGIHHFGSTAVPGLSAKPTIDIMIVLPSAQLADDKNAEIRVLGYLPRGAYGIGENKNHRFFNKPKRDFHVHVFEQGDPDIAWNLVFRDYLREHPQAVKEYENLKLDLIQKYALDRKSYREGKSAFIKRIKPLLGF